MEKINLKTMWCSAHLHCHFKNMVNLPNGNSVEFQSLDKPINRRKFSDVFQIKESGEITRFDQFTKKIEQIEIKSGFQ